ncbi:hypothetical protein SDC9_141973 [bioreactor metagenome]|uniref:Uncharacterized protein n=1 Tax=bioreactor metagenome TaxID=1076179 RepID=A0A645DZU4_9ZZZZ
MAVDNLSYKKGSSFYGTSIYRNNYNPFKSTTSNQNSSRKTSEKKKTFNSYDQRNYDLNYLEALLLGYEQYDENKLYVKEE